MKNGAPHCLFEVKFNPTTTGQLARTQEQALRWQVQQALASLVLTTLPEQEPGMTLFELQARLKTINASNQQLRPAILLESLQILQHAGLIASTANRAGDTLDQCRYWRVEVVPDMGLS